MARAISTLCGRSLTFGLPNLLTVSMFVLLVNLPTHYRTVPRLITLFWSHCLQRHLGISGGYVENGRGSDHQFTPAKEFEPSTAATVFYDYPRFRRCAQQFNLLRRQISHFVYKIRFTKTNKDAEKDFPDEGSVVIVQRIIPMGSQAFTQMFDASVKQKSQTIQSEFRKHGGKIKNHAAMRLRVAAAQEDFFDNWLESKLKVPPKGKQKSVSKDSIGKRDFYLSTVLQDFLEEPGSALCVLEEE
eukprot:m.246268 g.246268  ORF g.246268 m.246268 type:complete len:244 (-) comp26644_c0_seq4:371-1102(-)